jgi:hypothetical protein
MGSVLAACCCLVLLIIHCTSAAVILGNPEFKTIGSGTNLSDPNAVQYTAASVTARFTESDSYLSFAVKNDVSGINEFTVVTTQAEQYAFATTALKYGPENLYIMSMKACATDSMADVNLTSEVYIPTGVSGRRLLSAETDMLNGISPTSRKLMGDITSSDVGSCVGAIVSVGVGVGIVATVGYPTGLGSNCEGLNNAINSKLNAAEAKAAYELEQARIEWEGGIMELAVGQQETNRQVQITAAAVQAYTILQNQTNEQFKLAFKAQAATIDANFVAAQNGIQQLAIDSANSLVALNSGTDQKLIALQDKFVNTTWHLIQQIDDVVGLINSNQNRNDRTAREIVRSLQNFKSNVMKGMAGTNDYIDQEQLAQIWNALTAASSLGRTVMMDPSLPGTPPVTRSSMTQADITGLVDQHYINFVNVTGGSGPLSGSIIHQFGLTFHFNVPGAVQLNLVGGNWQDVQDLIGSPNCTNNVAVGQNAVDYCRGWFTITHKYCSRSFSPTFTWGSITTTGDRSAYVLSATQCGSVPSSVGSFWDGRRMDTVAQFHEFLGALCNTQGMIANTAFQIVSTRRGIVMVNTDYRSDVCGVNTDAIFNDGALTTVTLPYVIYRDYVDALASIQAERNAFTAKITGIRPRGFTNRFLPFYGLSNGHSYTCFQTSITTFDPDTQIYYSVKPTGVTPRVVIKVYDAEPTVDCSVDPCIIIPQGNLLRTESPESVDILTDTSVLPTADTILFGELAAGTMASVFDLDKSLVNLAPDSRSRVGHFDYTSWSIPSDYIVANNPSGGPPAGNLVTWEADNIGELYDHEASISPGYYRHDVDTTDGVCLPRPGVAFKGICNLLAQYKVDPSSDMRAGQLVLVPRQYTMVINFRALAGPIVLRVEAGCPDQSFDPSSLLGRVLTLTNSLPTEIKVLMQRTNTNPACPVDEYRATIPAKGVRTVTFAACGNYTAQVYTLPTDPLAAPIACGLPLTAALQEPTQGTTALSNLVNETALAVTTQLSQGIAASDIQLIALMLSIVSAQVPGISLTIAGVDFSAYNVNFTQMIGQLVLNAEGIDLTSNTVTEAIAPFMDRLDEIAAQQQQILLVMIESNANISALLDQQDVTLANLTQDFATLQVKSDIYIAIQQQKERDALSGAGWGGKVGCFNMSFLFAGMFCIIETALTYMLVAALIIGGTWGIYVLSKFLYQHRDAFSSNTKPKQLQRPVGGPDFQPVPTVGHQAYHYGMSSHPRSPPNLSLYES